MRNYIKPTHIRLETSSVCQLRCPSCPTTTRAIHPAIGSGVLKLSDFKQLLDANPQITDIELSNYGEIFLNPNLLAILEEAQKRRVALTANNGVNLNTVKDEVLEALVKYGFQSMNCSIDGASDETYKRYRIRGDFEKVIANIRKINAYKAQYNSDYPRLGWQFVVFGHNEHEIPAARQMAKELNMVFCPKISWDDEYSPIQNHEWVKKEVGLKATSRAQWKEESGADYMENICLQLWQRPQINWDGKVLGCCRNFWGDFGGNAFEDGLLPSVNHEKMRYARDMLTGRKPAREDIPCSTCDLYTNRVANGNWIKTGTKHSLRVLLGRAKRLIFK